MAAKGPPGLPNTANGRHGQLSHPAQMRRCLERTGRYRAGLRFAPLPGHVAGEAVKLLRPILGRVVCQENNLHIRSAPYLAVQRARLPGRGVALGDHGAYVGDLRTPSRNQGRGVRGFLHLAQLPAGRMRVAHRRPGQVPGRECSTALRYRPAQEDSQRPRNRDSPPGLGPDEDGIREALKPESSVTRR